MTRPSEDIQRLLDLLDAKEKKRRRNTFLYLGLPLLAGVLLTLWTAQQARALNKQRRELNIKSQELQKLKQEIDALNNQLNKTREQSDVMRQGLIDLQSRNYSDAIREFDRAIELDPLNPNAYNLKGYAQLRKKDISQAIETLKRSIEIDPNYIWGHYNLALAYWDQGDRAAAIEEVKKVLEINPEFRRTFRNDGQFRKFRSSPEYRNIIEKQDANQKRSTSR
jgi:tetratricopeptide (TPR) repeat protein